MKGTGLGAKMAGGNPDPERGRAARDFYPTPSAVTRALARHYSGTLGGAKVWEPCAGDGAMAHVLLQEGAARVVCSDIDPLPPAFDLRGEKIIRGDALKTKRLPPVRAVVTNPPFNIAADLIDHILCLPDGPPLFMALVLKATYWHSSRRAALWKRHEPFAIHPLRWRPDFKNLGAPTMDIMWCVWRPKPAQQPTVYVPFDHPGE